MFRPAFDRTDPNPKKNYGVGCLDIRFLVEGEKGMVEFQLLTNWYQEHVMKRRMDSLRKDILSGKEDFLVRRFTEPFPADICYFSPTRISEDDSEWLDGVRYFRDGAPCYYGYKYSDENGFVAKDVAFRLLVDYGDEALWKYLEEYYVEVFGEETAP